VYRHAVRQARVLHVSGAADAGILASLTLTGSRTLGVIPSSQRLEVFAIDLEAFCGALARENHTHKRALTDPRLFSGIGNAYSDEILHRARLSPLAMTAKLTTEESARLYEAARATLADWTDRLREHYAGEFSETVTAFRPDMAVHGRYKEPCPNCGTAVQRIRHADNETNYCPRCQTGGQLLADRAFSLLLRKDWPKTVDELERLGRA
jgi:formamidopyrimidine-DNA glycosylase